MTVDAPDQYGFARISRGPCYDLPVPENISPSEHLYVTINDYQEYKPFELFVRCDSPEYFELTTVLTRLVSMALRQGVKPDVIATELQEIYSPRSAHMVKGTRQECPSLTARIGQKLQEHLEAHGG